MLTPATEAPYRIGSMRRDCNRKEIIEKHVSYLPPCVFCSGSSGSKLAQLSMAPKKGDKAKAEKTAKAVKANVGKKAPHFGSFWQFIMQ